MAQPELPQNTWIFDTPGLQEIKGHNLTAIYSANYFSQLKFQKGF